MTLPDQVKIAVLLNETTGPLQQTLAIACRDKSDICSDQDNHHRVLQSNNSV